MALETQPPSTLQTRPKQGGIRPSLELPHLLRVSTGPALCVSAHRHAVLHLCHHWHAGGCACQDGVRKKFLCPGAKGSSNDNNDSLTLGDDFCEPGIGLSTT